MADLAMNVVQYYIWFRYYDDNPWHLLFFKKWLNELPDVVEAMTEDKLKTMFLPFKHLKELYDELADEINSIESIAIEEEITGFFMDLYINTTFKI